MAGFSVVMAFLFYSVIGLVMAVFTAIAANIYLKRSGRPRAAQRGALAPFLGLLWIVIALWLYKQTSNHLAHQSVLFSPDPYITLPNGYTLGSLNTYSGYIAAPGFKTGVPVAGPGYIRNLIDLELDGPTFHGTLSDIGTPTVRSFTMDTRSHQPDLSELPPGTKPQPYDSQESLDAFGAAQTHAQRDKNGYWAMYAKYRHSWPDDVAWALAPLGEGALVLWAAKG